VAPPEAASLGILGGTFNPPHLGHLALAREAREELGLGRVLLVPVQAPPHKTDAQLPAARHRLRMTELLVDGEPGVAASPIEIDRGGPSFTVDTLEQIHASHPDAELTFIVGADSASTLPAWRQPAKLLELARLAVAARPGSEREDVLDALAAVERAGRDAGSEGGMGRAARAARVHFLNMAPLEVSSSQARARSARGEQIEELVGPAVARYIAEHGLYGAGAPGRS